MEIFIVEFYEECSGSPFETAAFTSGPLARAFAAQRLHQILSDEKGWQRQSPTFEVYNIPVMNNLSLLTKYDNQTKKQEMDKMWDGRKSTVGD